MQTVIGCSKGANKFNTYIIMKTTVNLNSYEKNLTPETLQLIQDIIEDAVNQFNDERPEKIDIELYDISMGLGNGYGTWKTIIILHCNQEQESFQLSHHNEDVYLCQKTIRDCDSEEELNEALSLLNNAAINVISSNENEIYSWLSDILKF